MKKSILSLLVLVLIFGLVIAVNAADDTVAPLVTIEIPDDGDIVRGVVDIYGTIVEDIELSHYNIAIYLGDADFKDFTKRLEQSTVYQSNGFVTEQIYQWDTTNYEDECYLIRLAARDKAGNRDISQDPYTGGDDSQHVIRVFVGNTGVPIDIKPQSCPNPLNVKNQGVLPVAILGTDYFDVNNVDPSSIQLEGVSSVKWAFEDIATPFERSTDCFNCSEEGSDGFLDLTLKFDTQEILSQLNLSTNDLIDVSEIVLSDLEDGDCLILTLTGSLYDETPIWGEDTVLIIKKGK